MARTKIRESQVLDEDFTTEDELEERFNQHNDDKLHPPKATDSDTYLKFDGTDYVWSTVSSSSSLPDQTDQDGKYLRTDGSNAYWDSVQTTDPNDLLPEPDDENMILKSNSDKEWVMVRADDPEEGLKVIALPYYWDDERQKFLDNTMIRVIFYSDTTNEKNKYMKYVPEIRCDRIPFNVYPNESYCITQLEYATSDENNGEVMDIRNITETNDGGWGSSATYENIFTLDIGDDDIAQLFVDGLDYTIDEGDGLGVYIKGTSLDNPVLIVGLRKIWIPED